MKYIRRPPEVDAFEWKPGALAPEWFLSAMQSGDIIVLYRPYGAEIGTGSWNMQTCFTGDFVVRSEQGRIYVVDKDKFHRRFIPKEE